MSDDVVVSKVHDNGSVTYAITGPKNRVGKSVIDVFIDKPIAQHGTRVSDVLHQVGDRVTVVVQVPRWQ